MKKEAKERPKNQSNSRDRSSVLKNEILNSTNKMKETGPIKTKYPVRRGGLTKGGDSPGEGKKEAISTKPKTN